MEWEHIVNQHSDAKKSNKHKTHKKKLMHRVIVSATIAIAFTLATIFNLIHPFLGELGMGVALAISFFNLGRVMECGKNDF